ncbi:MAG: PAS domain-containing protein [Desulfovibrionales bacterium]|nr:PAS domain-containing protein [Desulfovibrionales bacterium]
MESERRLRHAVASDKIGVWSINYTDNRMEITTDSAFLLGYSLEEFNEKCTTLDLPRVDSPTLQAKVIKEARTAYYSWDSFIHPDDWPLVGKGLCDLFEGKQDCYEAEYRIRTKSGEWKWILAYGHISHFDENGIPVEAMGTHVDITSIKATEIALRQSEQALQQREKELEEKASALEEANTALKVLLNKYSESQHEIEANVFENVKQVVFPYIAKLKNSSLREDQTALVEVVEKNLQNITSEFCKKIHVENASLTPKEIQIVNLIREDYSSKEIAELLIMSPSAVAFHRNNIRKKLNLAHKKVNLTSWLKAHFE